jgi:hypothetical protein
MGFKNTFSAGAGVTISCFHDAKTTMHGRCRRCLGIVAYVSYRLSPFYLFLILFTATVPGCVTSQGAQSAGVAEQFIGGLNEDNLDAMMIVSREPFFFRRQEWESAIDGHGFVLGATEDKFLKDKESLRAFFRQLTSTIKVVGTKAAVNAPPKHIFLTEELKGVTEAWERLEIYVFRRGFGDVEHIVLVGVDPQDWKVTALYLN